MDIYKNPDVSYIRNRENDIIGISDSGIADKILEEWKFDILKMKPSKVVEKSGITSTNVDLVSYLCTLVDRRAIINIPNYKKQGTSKRNKNQIIDKNRKGKLYSIKSNKNDYRLSVGIVDVAVQTTDEIGFPRTFNITTPSGKMYLGWDKIEFIPDEKESEFINEYNIAMGNNILVKNVVEPNRWISVFGQYYIKSYMLYERLTDEIKHIKSFMNNINNNNKNNNMGKNNNNDNDYNATNATKRTYKILELKLFIPKEFWVNEFSDKYKDMSNEELCKLKKKLIAIKERLQFNIKATELAYNNMYFINKNAIPSWMKNKKWEQFQIKRTKWEKINIGQEKPGVQSLALLRRERNITRTVSL